MHFSASRMAAIALVAAIASTAVGCGPKSDTSVGTVDATSAVEATTVVSGALPPQDTSVQPPASSRGPVRRPTAGSTEHKAILKAATSALGISGSATMLQLFVQDGAAVGDLIPTSGQRTFFALAGGPSSWKLSWSAAYGSSKATASALTAIDPGVFTDLAKALDFKKPAPKTVVGTGLAPSIKSFEDYARKSAASVASGTYAGTFGVQAKIAKDSTGTWWGNGVATPADDSLESIGVWARWDGKVWKGEIADFSTEDAAAGYFPADVLASLDL